MKNTIKELLDLKSAMSKSQIELDNLYLKKTNSEKTALFLNVSLNHFIAALFAFLSICSLFFIEATPVYSSPLCGFILASLIVLDFYSIYKSCLAKDKTRIEFSTIVFVVMILLGIVSFLFFCLSTASLLQIESYSFLLYLAFSSVALISVLSFEDLWLYNKLNKIEKIDKNIVSLFEQKHEEFSLLEDEVTNKQNDIMNNRNSLLDIHEALDSDTLDRDELKCLKNLLKNITLANKERKFNIEEEKREKNLYKKEIEEYLGIENKETIVND